MQGLCQPALAAPGLPATLPPRCSLDDAPGLPDVILAEGTWERFRGAGLVDLVDEPFRATDVIEHHDANLSQCGHQGSLAGPLLTYRGGGLLGPPPGLRPARGVGAGTSDVLPGFAAGNWEHHGDGCTDFVDEPIPPTDTSEHHGDLRLRFVSGGSVVNQGGNCKLPEQGPFWELMDEAFVSTDGNVGLLDENSERAIEQLGQVPLSRDLDEQARIDPEPVYDDAVNEDSYHLYVGNLPADGDAQWLARSLNAVVLAMDPGLASHEPVVRAEWRTGRRYAFIVCRTMRDVSACFRLDGMRLFGGRQLKVGWPKAVPPRADSASAWTGW